MGLAMKNAKILVLEMVLSKYDTKKAGYGAAVEKEEDYLVVEESGKDSQSG